MRRPFRLTNSLARALHYTAGEKVTLRLSVLGRPTVQRSSADRRHADLHRFHLGLFQAPQPPIVARVPLHLTSNGAKHGQFRRLFNTLLETCSDTLQTPSTHEEVLNICGLFKEFFLSGPARSAGLTQRVNPNLGKTFKVDKHTTHVSQCTCPLLRHRLLFVMDDGEPAAALWF